MDINFGKWFTSYDQKIEKLHVLRVVSQVDNGLEECIPSQILSISAAYSDAHTVTW